MSEDAPAEPARRPLSRFEWACVAVAFAAFALRLDLLAHPRFVWDTAWFLALARSFAEDGTFLVRWTDPPTYSGYWPPLFPIWVSAFVPLVGPTWVAPTLAAVVASALLALAVLGTTWDLMGRARAFSAMALVAVSPAFWSSDARGMGESLLALLVTLAAWAFLRSLSRPAWLLPAAAFGALAYLAKATVGLPLAALGALALAAWRVRTRGLALVLRSPFDLAVAAALALGLLAAWLTRTGRVGGVGLGFIGPVREAVAQPLWVPVVLFKVAFLAAFLLVVTLPLSLRVRGAVRAPRTEATGALWLAVLFPLVAAAVFSASFYFTEDRDLVDFDNVRYLTPALVPFLWLLLPHWPGADEREAPRDAENARLARRHRAWHAAAVGVYVVLLALNPNAVTESPGRLAAFLALALVPLALALAAYASRAEAQPRVGADGRTRWRWTRARGGGADGRLMAGALVVGLALAWFLSSWYAGVLLGLAVALATPSPRARVVAMALVLLAASLPAYDSPLPVEEAAGAMERLPEGTLVAAAEPIVYAAAVAPSHVVLRPADLGDEGPDPAWDAMLLRAEQGEAFPGFVEVASWEYGVEPSWTLAARIAFERHVLGQRVEFERETALILHVREGLAPLYA